MANPVTDWGNSRWAWKKAVRSDSRLSDAAKVLAAALCDDFAHHETGFCNPHVGTLATALAKSDRAIQRALAELRKVGWIDTLQHPGRGKTSQILFLKGDGAVAFCPPEKVTHLSSYRAERVTPVAVKGDRSVAPPCTPYKDKPKLNQKAGATARPAPNCVKVIVPDSAEEGLWNDWLERHRLPSLALMGVRSSNSAGRGWDAPFPVPPNDDDALEYRITMKWANWAASRMVERQERRA